MKVDFPIDRSIEQSSGTKMNVQTVVKTTDNLSVVIPKIIRKTTTTTTVTTTVVETIEYIDSIAENPCDSLVKKWPPNKKVRFDPEVVIVFYPIH